MNRRRVLRLIGMGSVAGPVAAKAAAESAAADLIGVTMLPGVMIAGAPQGATGIAELSTDQHRQALLNPLTRRAVESLLYEDEQVVTRLDPDIACMRSFSLNAKITFQRQRNVERRMRGLQQKWPWQRLTETIREALGLRLF